MHRRINKALQKMEMLKMEEPRIRFGSFIFALFAVLLIVGVVSATAAGNVDCSSGIVLLDTVEAVR